MGSAPRRTTERARRPSHLVVGRVVRPHGVRGALLIEPLSQVLGSLSTDSLVYLGQRRQPRRVLSLKRHGRQYRLQLEGCADQRQAEVFRGVEVRVRLEEAPPLTPGRYYQWQIVGLRVTTEDGKLIGQIREVLETGANDVYLVDLGDGEEILLPAITSVVRGVDLEQGLMNVRLLPGLVETTRRKAASR